MVAPRITLHQPRAGEHLEAPVAPAYEVRLSVEESFVPSRDGQGVLISLDGGPPQRFLPGSVLRLGDLSRENAPIEEGVHALLVALIDAEGRVLRRGGPDGRAPYLLVDFTVGSGATSALPPLFCLSPHGTYYGAPGSGLRLELIDRDGATPEALPRNTLGTRRLRVEGEALDQVIEVGPERPYILRGVPLGDVRITDLARPAEPACVATINPERVRE